MACSIRISKPKSYTELPFKSATASYNVESLRPEIKNVGTPSITTFMQLLLIIPPEKIAQVLPDANGLDVFYENYLHDFYPKEIKMFSDAKRKDYQFTPILPIMDLANIDEYFRKYIHPIVKGLKDKESTMGRAPVLSKSTKQLKYGIFSMDKINQMKLNVASLEREKANLEKMDIDPYLKQKIKTVNGRIDKEKQKIQQELMRIEERQVKFEQFVDEKNLTPGDFRQDGAVAVQINPKMLSYDEYKQPLIIESEKYKTFGGATILNRSKKHGMIIQ